MKIIINAKNADRLQDEIDAAEGRATARCLALTTLYRATDYLDAAILYLPAKERKGITATISTGDRVPNNYGHRADRTYADIEYVASGWALVGVRRAPAPSVSNGTPGPLVDRIRISPAQARSILKHMLDANRISVIPES